MKLLKALPGHKAMGTHGIAYEALKLGRKGVEDILSYIFNHCLRLRLHTDLFKETITMVIRKGRKDADIPTSYRALAILNPIAKLFERILADRLKALVISHNLLPAAQYGAPGRSTTLAVEHLLNTVYRGWVCKMKVSILGLDLSGAYDHVDRAKLLKVLAARGIPDWLIETIWSFLSDRRTFIHMPGFEGDEYWIDVGIPQGSPLSPLLFLFYAAPILEQFNLDDDVCITMFSYVDDTYILVRSCRYTINTGWMKKVHDKLFEWAAANNLHFSPGKYHVMHFVNSSAKDPQDEVCNEIPDLPAFRNIKTKKELDDLLPKTMVILGVTFDKSLTWVPHIEEVSVYLSAFLMR